jgi:hypothetical protein
MINHLRTTLLNVDGSVSYGVDYPGEEAIDPGFTAKNLAGSLLAVHQLLFGNNPDRAMLNLRLRELLSVIHSSPDLSIFVTQLDSRLTYWPWKSNTLYQTILNGPVVEQIGPTTTELYVLGMTQPIRTTSERIYSSYLVEVLNATDVKVTWETDPNGLSSMTSNYTITAGLSSIVAFQGSELSFRFQDGIGAKWRITWLALPERLLGVLATDLLSNFTNELQDALFGDGTVEPYMTCKNIWNISPIPIYKAAAIAVALAYRIDALT